jgi:hypothetical protein
MGPGWRWTARKTLAEEHQWRAQATSASKAAAWYPAECRPPDWLTECPRLPKPEELEPEQIASLYRALRKGREDRKDEPGAADFYYGEMDMRRKAKSTSNPERIILSLYWLLSGYGLRASRALTALLATVVLFAALLYLVGLEPEHRAISTALLQSAEGATFRSGDREVLTEPGKALQLALRLLGPLFFGLALLSLRGRVKR